jgi:hypothetical protein
MLLAFILFSVSCDNSSEPEENNPSTFGLSATQEALREENSNTGPSKAGTSQEEPAKTGDELTQKKIERVIDSLDKALTQLDADKVMSHMAPSFTFKVSTEEQSRTLSRSEFKAQISKIMTQADSYESTRNAIQVTIADDGNSMSGTWSDSGGNSGNGWSMVRQ